MRDCVQSSMFIPRCIKVLVMLRVRPECSPVLSHQK
jgi:hypothetical protein